MQGPADARLGAATARAEKARQPHAHPAKQGRDLAQPPVLEVTSPAAGRAVRPQNRVIVGLHGNNRLLNVRQKPLRLHQRQPRVRDITKTAGPADLEHIHTPGPAVGPRLDQPQHPSHARSPSRRRPGWSYRFRPKLPSFWTLPTALYSEVCLQSEPPCSYGWWTVKPARKTGASSSPLGKTPGDRRVVFSAY